MEHGARRIHQRGMEIQEEYKDEVHHLQGLLVIRGKTSTTSSN